MPKPAKHATSRSILLTTLITCCHTATAGSETVNETLFGIGAGLNLISGARNNTLIGHFAGSSITDTDDNTYVGEYAGRFNIGNSNTFLGSSAGVGLNLAVSNNVMLGAFVGGNKYTGDNNVLIGNSSAYYNHSGADNVMVGFLSGLYSEGSGNVFLGHNAGFAESGSNKLFIENSSSNTPLIYGDFSADLVGINGLLGIGTQLPASTLHISKTDGSAQILVEETSATIDNRNMLKLSNNGGVDFILENTDAGTAWRTSITSGGSYAISLEGTGGSELKVKASGGLEAGPAGFKALDVRPNGNVFIAGTLTESSDKAAKENYQPVNLDEILAKVDALPITTWNYTHDPTSVRHIGPVAQDFHQSFGLGSDDKTVSPSDKIGVSLAAIKALNRKLGEKDLQIASLKAEFQAELSAREEAFNQRLARLEATLSQVVASQKFNTGGTTLKSAKLRPDL